MNVTIRLTDLTDETGTADLDGDGGPVTAAAARRVACDAAIIPVVLGANSEPLDVGRSSYVVPQGMRRALIVRDRGCAFPGCDRPPQWCEAHHVDHWANGGRTALGNLVLVCDFHHRLVHTEEWHIRIVDGHPEFIPPAWLDPSRTPLRNTMHHPPDTGQVA
jgi:5-methylcytosine-specific restriction protein A